jgi:hypothetical protein
MSTHVYVQAYSRSYAVIFMSDNIRTVLREVIRENGLSPEKLLVHDWDTIERGIRAWLLSGHLTKIVVEFFRPGASIATARWDIPIRYAGSGVDNDMWLDKAYLRQLIAKSARPTSDCTYRVLLCKDPGAPPVAGFSDCSFLSTGQLAARQAGTVIATGHMTAEVTYWR